MIGTIKINPIITIPDFRRSPWSHHFPLTDASGAVSWMSIQCWIVWHLFGLEFLSQGSVFFTDFVSIDFVTFGHMLVLLLVVSTISVFHFLSKLKSWRRRGRHVYTENAAVTLYQCFTEELLDTTCQFLRLWLVSCHQCSAIIGHCSSSTVVTVSGL